MKMTLSRTFNTFIVHELLRPGDPITPCDDAPKDSPTRMDPALPNVMHHSELRGTDFLATPDGFWNGIAFGSGSYHGVDINVDAGPILHRGNVYPVSLLRNHSKVVRSMYWLRFHRKPISV